MPVYKYSCSKILLKYFSMDLRNNVSDCIITILLYENHIKITVLHKNFHGNFLHKKNVYM